jgi:putative polyhydroxyalkanoate system protein
MAQARALARRAVESLSSGRDVEREWDGDVLRFRHRGAEGELRLSASEIHIGVRLNFLLRPFKARVAEGIEEHLDRLLPRPARKSARRR